MYAHKLTTLDLELQERNQPPDFEAKPEEFAAKNKGRLVAKFLMSLLDENAMKGAGKASDPVPTE